MHRNWLLVIEKFCFNSVGICECADQTLLMGHENVRKTLLRKLQEKQFIFVILNCKLYVNIYFFCTLEQKKISSFLRFKSVRGLLMSI